MSHITLFATLVSTVFYWVLRDRPKVNSTPCRPVIQPSNANLTGLLQRTRVFQCDNN